MNFDTWFEHLRHNFRHKQKTCFVPLRSITGIILPILKSNGFLCPLGGPYVKFRVHFENEIEFSHPCDYNVPVTRFLIQGAMLIAKPQDSWGVLVGDGPVLRLCKMDILWDVFPQWVATICFGGFAAFSWRDPPIVSPYSRSLHCRTTLLPRGGSCGLESLIDVITRYGHGTLLW